MTTVDEMKTAYSASIGNAATVPLKIADANDRLDRSLRRALRTQAQSFRARGQHYEGLAASGRGVSRLAAYQGGGSGGAGTAGRNGAGAGFSGAASFGAMGRAASSAFGIVRQGFGMAVGLARGLAVGVGVVAGAFLAFSIGAVKQAMAFDNLRRGLDSIAGGAAEGAKQWERLRALAKMPGIGFEQAVAGSIGLQSTKQVSAGTAEKLMAAVARVNRGGAGNFGGVMEQLIQTAGSGKLQGDEVRIISERLPQFRTAIQDAFGTTDGKKLAAMGIPVEQMLSRIADALNKMPSAGGGGIQNAFDNIGDSWKFLLDSMGRAAFPFVTTVLNTVAPFLEFLVESGTAAQVANGFISAIQGVVGNGGGIISFFALFTAIMLNLPTILTRLGMFIGNLFTSLSTIFVNTYNTIGPIIVGLINLVGQAISSLNSLGGPGAVLAGGVGAAMLLRGGGGAAAGALGWAGRGALANPLVAGGAAAAVGGALTTNAVRNSYGAGSTGDYLGTIGGRALSGAGVGAAFGSVVPGLGTAAGALVGGGVGGLYGLYENIANQRGAQMSAVERGRMADQQRLSVLANMRRFGGPGSGGGGTAAERAQIETAKNPGVTATETRKLPDLNRAILGGSEIGRLGITPQEIGSFLGNRSQAPVVVNAAHPGLKSFIEDVAEQVLGSRRRAEAF